MGNSAWTNLNNPKSSAKPPKSISLQRKTFRAPRTAGGHPLQPRLSSERLTGLDPGAKNEPRHQRKSCTEKLPIE